MDERSESAIVSSGDGGTGDGGDGGDESGLRPIPDLQCTCTSEITWMTKTAPDC